MSPPPMCFTCKTHDSCFNWDAYPLVRLFPTSDPYGHPNPK
jgi:hypothetical protein